MRRQHSLFKFYAIIRVHSANVFTGGGGGGGGSRLVKVFIVRNKHISFFVLLCCYRSQKTPLRTKNKKSSRAEVFGSSHAITSSVIY